MNRTVSAKNWLSQAKHDLDMAEQNLKILGFDICAFLSHQSVEKLLKSIYAFELGTIPRTHHIIDLANELILPESIMQSLLEISGDYTLSRYPDFNEIPPFEAYNKEISLEKLTAAQRIFTMLNEKIINIEESLEK